MYSLSLCMPYDHLSTDHLVVWPKLSRLKEKVLAQPNLKGLGQMSGYLDLYCTYDSNHLAMDPKFLIPPLPAYSEPSKANFTQQETHIR